MCVCVCYWIVFFSVILDFFNLVSFLWAPKKKSFSGIFIWLSGCSGGGGGWWWFVCHLPIYLCMCVCKYMSHILYAILKYLLTNVFVYVMFLSFKLKVYMNRFDSQNGFVKEYWLVFFLYLKIIFICFVFFLFVAVVTAYD